MSRTLSKVLIICALVVVLPLMIAGTAFAAYYSINATVSIEIFVDQDVNGGRAEVSYKDQTGRIGKKLEVTDGHLKKVTFKTSSVGYDFVGWYAGTYKALAEELEGGKDISEIKYVVKSKDAKVEMTDYQNLVAVFTAKRFTVGYKYIDSPIVEGDGTGVEVTTAPSSNARLLVDGKEDTIGKYEFVYGEKLHTIEFKGHPEYTFDGWYVGEGTTKYDTAKFVESGDIVLTGKWVDSQHITLTYLDDQGNVISKDKDDNAVKTDLYADHTYALADPMNFNYTEGFVEDGYAYVWKDVDTGNALTSINSSKDVVVKISKTAVVYTAKLDYDNTELQLAGNISNELTFSVENKTTLDAWKDASNWTATYSFWHFDHLTYNGDPVTDFESIINTVIAENPHSTTEITFSVEKKVDISEVSFDKLKFASENDDFVFGGPVYKETTQLVDETVSENKFDTTLYEVFALTGTNGQLADFYNAPNKEGKIELNSIAIRLGTSTTSNTIQINETTTLNDLIEKIYELKNGEVSEFVTGGVLTCEVTVCFK